MLEIEIVEYDGLVHDLMVAGDESFVAEGIIVHNCSMLPLVDGYPLPQFQRGEEWFRKQSPAMQQKMMGKGRYSAWQNNRFRFGQLADVGEHPIWGPSLRETTLNRLLDGRGGLDSANDPLSLLEAFRS